MTFFNPLSPHQKKILLVEERNNPSTDYFITPALAFNGYRVTHFDFSNHPDPDDLNDAVVIFIRYVPPNWVKLIDDHRNRLNGLIFFMDDDVLDFKASLGMPWRYRYKLARLSALRAKWLKRQRAEMWVSTPYLQQKYASWAPKLVLPSPVEAAKEGIRVFYHGSPATHKAEIAWLHPVMEKVLKGNDKISFEIIGGADVNRLYRDLPRVNVIHPMKWPSYQSFISVGTRHIGLAPQLDIPFNHARSYTKFFDINRCGAVGIFSPNSASADMANHNVDGLIIDLKQEDWAEAILKLANEGSLRSQLYENATRKISGLKLEAQQSYGRLFVR